MFWLGALLGTLIFAAMAQRPQQPKIKPATYEEMSVPTAEAGKEITIGYGLNLFESPNVVWSGDFDYKEIKK